MLVIARYNPQELDVCLIVIVLSNLQRESYLDRGFLLGFFRLYS